MNDFVKKKFLFKIVCTLSYIFINTSIKAQDRAEMIEIAMQDNFANDTVSVKIGKCILFKNRILTSGDTGFSGLIAEYFHPNNMMITYYGEKRIVQEKKCRINLKKDIILHLKLNGKKSDSIINLNNGKRIGLSKGKRNNFEIRQKERSFQYD